MLSKRGLAQQSTSAAPLAEAPTAPIAEAAAPERSQRGLAQQSPSAAPLDGAPTAPIAKAAAPAGFRNVAGAFGAKPPAASAAVELSSHAR